MNKYIRVEDGIYEIFDTHNGCSNHFGFKYNEYCTVLLDEEEIKNYRQADTIKELCDVLVVEEQNIYNDDIHKYLMEQPFIFEKDGDFSKTLSVKGAIWTDQGLIYVAKMNSEGELELINE